MALTCAAALLACEPLQAPPPEMPVPEEAASATASAAPPRPADPDPTCGGRLQAPAQDAAPAGTGGALVATSDPPVPLAPLGSAVPDTPALKVAKGGAAIDVGTVPVRIPLGHPRAGTELPRVALEHDLVASDLAAPIRAHWDEWFAARRGLQEASLRRARAEQALHDCSACKERVCLTRKAAAAEREAGDAKRSTTAELEAVAAALDRSSAEPAASPGVLLAAAWVLDVKARVSDDRDALPRLLAHPIELYAKALERDSKALRPFARYFRAAALEDTGRAQEAFAEWTEIANAGSDLSAEAGYHAGGLDTDVARAVATLRKARALDHSPAQQVALAASIRALGLAEDAGRWDEALEAALWLSRYPLADDDVVWGIAEAIDSLGGALPADASVPRRVFAKVAIASAAFAIDRDDDGRARRVWTEVVKDLAGSPEAEVAKGELSHPRAVVPPKEMLRARLSALGRSCRPAGAGVAVVEADGTRGGVTFRGTAEPDKALGECMDARKAWFLANATGSGTVEAMPAFRGRVVVEVAQP
jgi:hypothetical protein